jgi:hypothetical protein
MRLGIKPLNFDKIRQCVEEVVLTDAGQMASSFQDIQAVRIRITFPVLEGFVI